MGRARRGRREPARTPEQSGNLVLSIELALRGQETPLGGTKAGVTTKWPETLSRLRTAFEEKTPLMVALDNIGVMDLAGLIGLLQAARANAVIEAFNQYAEPEDAEAWFADRIFMIEDLELP